jgi:hypothetical protein
MTVFRISRGFVAALFVVAAVTISAREAVAQNDPKNETQQYSTTPAGVLDPNYGLPTFGTPGAEVPQAKAMPSGPDAVAPDALDPGIKAPDQKTASGVPDFFSGSTEIALPKTMAPRFGSSDMETPSYTTSDGSMPERSTLGEMETSSGDTLTPEKPAIR